MIPKLAGIDHLHVYVSDRQKAAAWYQEFLGFTINQEFAFWAEDPQGPLTIENPSGKIHLALFARDDFTPMTVIAFKTDGAGFMGWQAHLQKTGLLLRCSDHTISWSLYFNDLEQNMHEITTYDYDYVRSRLTTK